MQACAGPRRHLTTIVSGQLSGDSRGSAFAFNNLHDAVNTGKDEFLAQAAGPEDFEFVDFGGGAEAEVEAQVGSGGVAGATEDVAALADAACGQEDFRAHGVARGMVNWSVGRSGNVAATVVDWY